MEIQTTIQHHKKAVIRNQKKIIKNRIIFLSVFLIIYLGISMYFDNHFYYGSVINGINASGKTVAEVDKNLLMKSEAYILEFKERNGVKEQIKSTDIDLKYNAVDKIQDLIDNQNSFAWIFAGFHTKAFEMDGIVTYDDKLLKEHFDKFSCFDSKKVIQPKNANFKYLDSGYVVVNEVMGNKVNRNEFYTSIVNAILKSKTKLDLEAKKLYINPKYTSTSKEIINTKALLNKYITSNITYTYAGGNTVIDKSVINKWLKVDNTNLIIFSEDKIKDYISELDNHYETYGKEREFVTSVGKTVKVSGGDYGWKVERAGEVADLIVAIKNGETIAKEPRYTEKGLNHEANDIGNTYVEINITTQHLWFYKNGKLITDGDVVTGMPTKDRETPIGIYKLKYKSKDATLKGEGYSVPVSVFMPFNGGIGIHDATWRKGVFGGNIYLENGSHGCINSPPSLAKTIYNNIDANTPVICYLL
ncbi:L,D-transpeptidase family protein [Clostridium sp.]|uniref:L,D-transpeptidase family protein n=1 Tax=Clostridium sp. TaxID=1506 RepID=UPI003D6C8F8D